jgi:hypothetical protein
MLGEAVDSDYKRYPVLPNGTPTKINLEVKDTKHVSANVGNTQPKVQLVFRNSGQLTQRETNGVGYQTDKYDGVTNTLNTTALGAANPAFGDRMYNFEETSATVPTNAVFNINWKWHRDVQDKAWLWNPASSNNIGNLGEIKFAAVPPGGSSGNDDGGTEVDTDDSIPDATRRIINIDAPGLGWGLMNTNIAPPGSIMVHRLYAHEWLTWKGGLASDVLRWRSFLTIRRKTDLTWERVGTNVIDLTPTNSNEIPVFTPQELDQIRNQ